ncbi:MAG: ABC transporter ATP-binding protein, partial [Lentisphaeria bacterium]|nr:ABC transporter ATP-binding protein [Lentisphaeria bacterium]
KELAKDKMISAEALHFAYGKKKVLDGVDFVLPSGTLTAVCGVNGCGKSTLLKCLCRLVKPDAGIVKLDERRLDTLSRREVAQQVAFMSQECGYGGNFTVAELAAMGRYAFGGGDDRKIIAEALALAGVEKLRSRRISSLSGGERQRAFLALALAQTPAVLLLDEPFSALDPAAVRELTGVLLALKAEKKMSIVMVVHDLNLALHSADILLGLQAGKVAFCAPPKECADALPELFFLPQELLQSGSDGRKYLFPC